MLRRQDRDFLLACNRRERGYTPDDPPEMRNRIGRFQNGDLAVPAG